MSQSVPFYTHGYYHITAEERSIQNRGKSFSYRASECKMLGYADTQSQCQIKNSYIVRTVHNTIITRHDCYFAHYTSIPSLLNKIHDDLIIKFPISSDETSDILISDTSLSNDNTNTKRDDITSSIQKMT